MSVEHSYFGNQFLHPWIGIIERRSDDDMKIGRCKVRIFGYHSADVSLQPTESLPDAYPLEPLTGGFWSTAKEGDSIFGFFLDEKKQSLLMVGKLPVALQNEVSHPDGTGFKDARTDAELSSFPRQYIQSYSYSTEGVSVTEIAKAVNYPPYGINKSSLPFLARADESVIPMQIAPKTKKQFAAATKYNTADGKTWSEPQSPWAAKYPFNHVYESESLHVIELDDTPGAERVKIQHRFGTGFEIFPDGTIVCKNVKDNYEITLGKKKVGISGDCDIHIKGNHTLLVDGNLTQHVSGDYFLSVDGEMKTLIRGNDTKNVGSDCMIAVDGIYAHVASGPLYVQGSPFQLNSSGTPSVPEIHDFDLPDLPDDTITNTTALTNATGTAHAANDDGNLPNG